MPNYEIKRTPEVTFRSNYRLRPAPLISALGPMLTLRGVPSRPFLSLLLALVAGTLIGTFMFAVLDVLIYGSEVKPARGLPDLFHEWVSSVVLGCMLVVGYALPILVILLRLRIAGPGSAFIVALLPVLFLFSVGEAPKILLCVSAHMVSAFVVFCYYAYLSRGP